MAAQSRKPKPSLRELLFEEPYRFGFFQAVRLLRASGARGTGKSRSASGRFPVRFRARNGLSFAPSPIVSLEPPARPGEEGTAGQSVMTVAFMGLADHEGVLPDHYTELLLERERARDYALRDFLDLFNNRLVQLFYSAWERPRYYVPLERREDDPLSKILYALTGLGLRRIRKSVQVAPETFLYYAGLLTRRPMSLDACQVLLSHFFGPIPFELRQFTGRWLELDEDSRSCLGIPEAANHLGEFCPLGSRIWDIQGQIGVRIGPLSRREFDEFSPGGKRAEKLAHFLKFLAGGETDVATELILGEEKGHGGRLGGSPEECGRLGVTTWLGATLAASVTHQNH